jgi:hypothetical protein
MYYHFSFQGKAMRDALSWGRISEAGVEKRRSARWAIYPSEAQGLKPVIAGENPKTDGRLEPWDAYDKILPAFMLLEDGRAPRMVEDDDWANSSFIQAEGYEFALEPISSRSRTLNLWHLEPISSHSRTARSIRIRASIE